jgi:hypothetical protein
LTAQNVAHYAELFTEPVYIRCQSVPGFSYRGIEEGYDVWRDRTGSSIWPPVGGGLIKDQLTQAVDKASWVIVFVSDHFVNSEYCLHELQVAREKRKKVCFVRFSTEFSPSGLGQLIASDQYLYCIPSVAAVKNVAPVIVKYIKNH